MTVGKCACEGRREGEGECRIDWKAKLAEMAEREHTGMAMMAQILVDSWVPDTVARMFDSNEPVGTWRVSDWRRVMAGWQEGGSWRLCALRARRSDSSTDCNAAKNVRYEDECDGDVKVGRALGEHDHGQDGHRQAHAAHADQLLARSQRQAGRQGLSSSSSPPTETHLLEPFDAATYDANSRRSKEEDDVVAEPEDEVADVEHRDRDAEHAVVRAFVGVVRRDELLAQLALQREQRSIATFDPPRTHARRDR